MEKDEETTTPKKDERIIPRVIEDEMKQSYLDYAMSVIVGRALPDAKDGLKPVHRRILFSMYNMGVKHNTPFRKSARIVGDTMGRYHPHGDQAIYDTLVRMAQDWSMRYLLVDGQGNFGCFTKDTKVQLADGRQLSFEELVKEDQQGKKNHTYTVNDKGKIKIALIKKPRLTKEKAELMKVTLDNNEEIRCTPNHKYMLKDGSYKEAQQLQKGESLMPFYTRLATKEDTKQELVDYALVKQPKTEKWEFAHHLADEFNIAEGAATSRETGQCNYFDNKEMIDIVNEATENHCVQSIEPLHTYEDVYDLTIEGTHNFALAAGIFVHNSIDGDNAAAMRYSEARMKRLAEEMLADIDKETVTMTDNFDGSLKEPAVLPTRIPNLLMNGSSGIAVGMATNMPPHNLTEIGQAIIHLIDHPEAEPQELMRHVKGPDFPTGGIINGTSGIINAYKYGKGRIKVRAAIEEEEHKKGRSLIIKEIPYMVNKSLLIQQIADGVREKRIEGIRDLRDESDRKGMRIVIELRNDANPDVVQNQLYKHSRCQETFGINNLALVDGQPKILGLKELLDIFIEHRKDVITRRTQHDLAKAKQKAHILQGLVKALDHIDAIINLIKKASDAQTAQQQLMSKYALSEEQSKAILEMRLSRLAALEQEKIRKDLEETLTLIKELQSILDDIQKVLDIIKEETRDVMMKYGDARRTEIIEGGDDDEIDLEDLIDEEDMVITISTAGYCKRLPIDTYKAQRRGGRGIKGATTKEEDALEHLFVANTHNYLLVFTSKGRVHWLKVYRIPEAGRYSKGTAMVNLIQLQKEEKVSAVIPVQEFDDEHYLTFITKKGTLKKTTLEAYSRPRQGGIIAITLNEGDYLVGVLKTDGNRQLLIATANGMAVKCDEKDVRAMGRTSTGVRGITLGTMDRVIGMVTAPDDGVLATITENGYGKKTRISDYRLINRGGKGVRNIICSARNGVVVAVRRVEENDDLMFITKKGIVIRTPAKDISTIGRNTQGMRLMRLGAGDKVVSAAKIIHEENEDVHETEE